MKKITDLIKKIRIEASDPGPGVLVIAGVHGDEYEPMMAAQELIMELPQILAAGSVTVITIVNISAYSIGSRFGKDNLDLARICPGNPNGSISEKSAFQISELIMEADYLIDMHTGGATFDIYPMAGYMLHPSPEILKRQQQLAMLYNLPVVWGTDYRPNGRTLSIARDANVPAIYLEYGGGSGFRNEVVKTYKEGFINVLKFLKMTEGTEEILSSEGRFWVEESKWDSGYLQGKMPSPSDGIFMSDKVPGDSIRKGERFGRIVNPYTGNSSEIHANMDGTVLSVRVSVKVKTGDALGAILPILEPGKISVA